MSENKDVLLGEQELELDKLDYSAQTRAGLRQSAVDEYAAQIEVGVEFEPAGVVWDGVKYILAAGFHRAAAYRKLGCKSMPCIVLAGTWADAVRYGIGDNNRFVGERLTNADKRHNVDMAIAALPDWSSRAIADLCRVSHGFVDRRRELSTVAGDDTGRRVGVDGKIYTKPPSNSQPSHVATVATCPPSKTSQGTPTADNSTADSGDMPDIDAIGNDSPSGEPSADFLAESESDGTATDWADTGADTDWDSFDGAGAAHPAESGDGQPDSTVDGGGLEDEHPLGTASSTPASADVIERQFATAIKAIGIAKREHDRLSDLCPGGHYPRVLAALDAAAAIHNGWHASWTET